MDVLLWLKSKGERGYQSRLNTILREAMARETQKPALSGNDGLRHRV